MLSAPIVLVSLIISSNRTLLIVYSELAVSLNSNNAQIFTREGAEWIPTEILSEVRFHIDSGCFQRPLT